MLYAGALSYFAANDVNLKILNKGDQALAYQKPSFGTFSTNLNPIYSFGVPRQVKMSGIMVDMDAVAQSLWTKNNDAQLAKTLVQQVGMMTSVWEHRIPEMLFTNEENPGEAVSAVKALSLASAQGQRIYQVTKENVNAVLPVLNISSEVKDEIRASVAVGKVATVSQNNITVGDWTGVGYIIADAETGAAAYRISGGNNGGIFIPHLDTLMATTILGIWAIATIFMFGPIAGIFAAFLVLAMAHIYADGNPCVDFSWDIFFWSLGLAWAFRAIGIAIKSLSKNTLGEYLPEIIMNLAIAYGSIRYPPAPHDYPSFCTP